MNQAQKPQVGDKFITRPDTLIANQNIERDTRLGFMERLRFFKVAQAKFVVADAVTTVIKRMAQARRISEPDVWRMVVARGIEGIELSELSDNLRDEIRKEMGALRSKLRNELLGDMTRVMVENLCLTRRLAGATNKEIIRQAKEDAKIILKIWGKCNAIF